RREQPGRRETAAALVRHASVPRESDRTGVPAIDSPFGDNASITSGDLLLEAPGHGCLGLPFLRVQDRVWEAPRNDPPTRPRRSRQTRGQTREKKRDSSNRDFLVNRKPVPGFAG